LKRLRAIGVEIFITGFDCFARMPILPFGETRIFKDKGIEIK